MYVLKVLINRLKSLPSPYTSIHNLVRNHPREDMGAHIVDRPTGGIDFSPGPFHLIPAHIEILPFWETFTLLLESSLNRAVQLVDVRGPTVVAPRK